MNIADLITITVATQYLDDSSDPQEERYVFSYTIQITNNSEQSVQLLNREWLITDANQHTQEVRGAGVVGKQPQIEPGESFEYSSGAVFETPFGYMQGRYEMKDEAGLLHDVPIPVFTLATPNLLH